MQTWLIQYSSYFNKTFLLLLLSICFFPTLCMRARLCGGTSKSRGTRRRLEPVSVSVLDKNRGKRTNAGANRIAARETSRPFTRGRPAAVKVRESHDRNKIDDLT